MKVGIQNLLAISDLPVLRPGVRAGYEGSIDKLGDNADWDWWLYQDTRGEWVIFDVDGPGCIHNFVQHRYPTSPEVTFRFYFDGETEPRFEIKHSEFGGKSPLLEPLAGYFEGDDAPPRGRGPIHVVRSFVPMPFAKSCRITSSLQLMGYRRDHGEGGWGHVIYHTYASDPGIETFTGREDLSALLDLCQTIGQVGTTRSQEKRLDLAPGATVDWLQHEGAGAIEWLTLRLVPYDFHSLHDLWVVMHWDGHEKPDVEAPLGAFFGNEYGLRAVAMFLTGRTDDGRLYSRYPMPFWESAHIQLQNRGSCVRSVSHAIGLTHTDRYRRGACGYFRATAYHPPTPATPGQDTIIGLAFGRGHIVACTLTARSIDGSRYVSCEGDVRLYIDDNTTPQIESDGTESHACYGWGFVTPGQQNLVSGYDGSGSPTCEFSLTRTHPGDWIPFQTKFRFCLEAGDRNNGPLRHSGLVLYYSVDQPGMTLTDTLDIGDETSQRQHDYQVTDPVWQGELENMYENEGAADRPLIRDRGCAFNGRSEFTVRIDPVNVGVRLRRRCDQIQGRQRARVRVDGQVVAERTWYVADRNPHFRWLDSEFDIPAHYTAGKQQLRITIERVPMHDDGLASPPWSEFRYDVFSLHGAS